MALFPERTPDEIVFGVFFIVEGIFFYRIFELSPWFIRELPKASLAAGVVFLSIGCFKLINKRFGNNKEKAE